MLLRSKIYLDLLIFLFSLLIDICLHIIAQSFVMCCIETVYIYKVYIFIAADIISCVEFNHDGDLLATGDKGGRVVIFQRDPIVSAIYCEI